MDEMQSDSPNNVNGKKVRSKTTEQHELTESPQKQTEKRRDKKDKRRNSQTESDDNLQTHTGKKKRRKLDNEGETTVMDDGVSNQHEAQTQELQGSSEEKPSKRRIKREKLKQTNCEDMAKQEQTDTETEHEEEPNTCNEGSDSPDETIGNVTRTRKTRKIPVNLKLLEELKEFCPTLALDTRTDNAKNQLIKNDLPRFKDFRKQGIEVRRGRFSEAENKRLRQNVDDFLALTKVADAYRLFNPKRYPNQEMKLSKLKKKYGFYKKIAEGIPRPCHDVYLRGKKIYDCRHYKGNFTEDDDNKLLKYYKRYGPKWQKLSEKTGRSAPSLSKRLPLISLAKRKGLWTKEEVQRLLRAVRDHVVSVLKSANPNKKKPKRVSREILYQNLPWTTIAEIVETRCYKQCRDKWMSILSVRMSSGTLLGGKTALLAKIRLIKTMYEMQFEEMADVDWGILTAAFGNVPPAYVQRTWRKMKNWYVPDWNTRSFADTVSYLHNNILPRMEKRYQTCKGFDVSKVKVEQKELFRLSKIFKDIEEDGQDIKEEGQGIKEDGQDIKEEGQDIKEDGQDIKEEGQDIKEEGRDGDEETGKQENNSFNQ